jgi:hypothetical protein
MISQLFRVKRFCMRGLLSVLAVIACFPTATLGANKITGAVSNDSRGEPAAADGVSLLRLDREMEEEAHAKTDANGVFTFTLQHPDKPYLVRVIHQGVSYDQQASAGDSLSIQVFDAARRVRGLTGSIEILRAGTNGNLLHVSDLVELKNESSPPLTQAGERTLDVYLPANAKIDSVIAAGPGEIGVMISATPVAGEPGHYTVSFPLRPGASRFGFNYDLPYDGQAAFQTRHAYPLQQFAVMIPPTMKFSSRSRDFGPLATGNNNYEVQASYQLAAGEGPEFELSGTGTLPALGDQAKSQARSRSSAVPNPTRAAPARAALPSLASIDPRLRPTQPLSQSVILGGVTFVLLAACALLLWRARKARNFSAAQTIAPRAHQDNLPQPDRKA